MYTLFGPYAFAIDFHFTYEYFIGYGGYAGFGGYGGENLHI